MVDKSDTSAISRSALDPSQVRRSHSRPFTLTTLTSAESTDKSRCDQGETPQPAVTRVGSDHLIPLLKASPESQVQNKVHAADLFLPVLLLFCCSACFCSSRPQNTFSHSFSNHSVPTVSSAATAPPCVVLRHLESHLRDPEGLVDDLRLYSLSTGSVQCLLK